MTFGTVQVFTFVTSSRRNSWLSDLRNVQLFNDFGLRAVAQLSIEENDNKTRTEGESKNTKNRKICEKTTRNNLEIELVC